MVKDGGTSSPDALLVRVLGPTAVERGGESLPIGGKRQRAVLARLALAEGRLVTVDRLVEDLWGEDAQSSILTTLHGYVSRLRGALQDASLLRREGPGYLLDVSADQVDARRFEALLADARQSLDSEPGRALEQLDEALALWRGPAFADVEEMDWAHAAATRLTELRLAAMELRFDALLALGRHTGAVAELEAVAQENPLRERFAAQLALALYRAGRQSDALRAIDRTRRVLLDELGLDPSPDLVKLETAILAHDDWLAAPVAPTAPAATPGAATQAAVAAPSASPVALPPAVERHMHRVFVGRAQAMEELRTAWHEALGGDRRFVVVEGEAGSGKSRLAAHFAVEAHGEGAIVLWGRATSEAIVPYEPLVEALRTVLRTVSPEARHRVVDGRRGLATLLPFVPGIPELDVASSGDLSGSDRYVLFETVAELLDSESAVHPIVFVLDDLQWADGLSMRLLQHLMQHERRARLLVVATVRTVPVTENPNLDALTAELRRDGTLRCVELGGLDETEVAELLECCARIPASQAAAVHRATHGNPFFVTEVAEHGDATTLPASVRDALGARMSRLSPDATRLLGMAAVAGTSATLPVLSRASGLGSDAFLDAVDETLNEGLLVEDESTGALQFRHAIVQQVVLERFSRTRRSTMHLTLADAVEQAGGGTLELAHHLLEAGALAAPERRVDAAVAAGREAIGLLAYEDGVLWGQRALVAAATGDARCRCEALLLLSDAQRSLGDRAAAREAATKAADEARRTGDPVLLARSAEAVALARAGIGFDFGTEDAELHSLLVEALSVLPDDELGHRAKLLEASMSNAAADGNLAALRGLSQEALALADAQGAPGLVATAHLAFRMSNWQVQLLPQRLDADRKAWEAALASGNTSLQLNALLYGIADHFEAGLVREADDWLEQFRVRANRVRQPVYDAFLGFFDATVALLRGHYDHGAKLVDEALLRGLQSHGVNAEHAWAGHAFIRAWDQGQLGSLIDTVESAATRPATLPIWRIGYGCCLVATGRHEEARAILEEFVTARGLQHNPDSVWLAVACLLTEIAREVGDRERAGILLREMRPYEGRLVITGLGRASLGPVNRYMGVAAHMTGDLDEAERLLRSAGKQARFMFATPHHARALHDLAAVIADRDGPDSPEVAELRERARQLAEPIGLVLGGLGVSAPT